METKKDSIWQSDKLTINHVDGITDKDFTPGINLREWEWNDYEEAMICKYKYISEENEIIKNISKGKKLVFSSNVFNAPEIACNKVFDEYYEMTDKLNITGTFPGCKNEDASPVDKKLEIIARICQNLDQMHLFYDGNIRTIGFLILNKFLIENDLSPTIMYDPNMIDLRSIQEIIDEIKKGQDYFRETFSPEKN